MNEQKKTAFLIFGGFLLFVSVMSNINNNLTKNSVKAPTEVKTVEVAKPTETPKPTEEIKPTEAIVTTVAPTTTPTFDERDLIKLYKSLFVDSCTSGETTYTQCSCMWDYIMKGKDLKGVEKAIQDVENDKIDLIEVAFACL
jgi:hypothetical protein